jgi:cell division protein FtsZ
VTGVGRGRAAPAAPPPITAGPVAPPQPAAPQPQQQRLGPLDPADRVTVSKGEEDLLEIPAFLRRQAN